MEEGLMELIEEEKYYWTCPKCGANNDPGERCDCEKEQSENPTDYKAVTTDGGDKNDTDTV
jgi:hypothetical protein